MPAALRRLHGQLSSAGSQAKHCRPRYQSPTGQHGGQAAERLRLVPQHQDTARARGRSRALEAGAGIPVCCEQAPDPAQVAPQPCPARRGWLRRSDDARVWTFFNRTQLHRPEKGNFNDQRRFSAVETDVYPVRLVRKRVPQVASGRSRRWCSNARRTGRPDRLRRDGGAGSGLRISRCGGRVAWPASEMAGPNVTAPVRGGRVLRAACRRERHRARKETHCFYHMEPSNCGI
jgi:hypothetical protein